MNIPDNLKFTKDHEWVKTEGKIGTVGITDFAQGELGDIIYIDIPLPDAAVKQGDSFGTIEAVKTVSDIFAPVSGKIVEVNTSVNNNPASVNKDPYGEGWIVKIEMSEQGELNNLLTPEKYKELVGA
jgi:glycine cleavage system H protein